MTDLITAVREIRGRAEEFEKALDFYTGEVPEVFCSEAVRRTLRDQVNGFDVNLARRPVDAVLDRVRILAVSVPDNDAATRELIDRVWVPNRMDRKAKTVHWGSLVYGDFYVTVWEGADEGTVEIHPNAPGTTRVFYDPENPQVKAYAAKVWTEGSGDQAVQRCTLYYPDRIEKWVTDPGKRGDEQSEWHPLVEAWELDDLGESVEVWPIPNPHGEVPVFHFPNGDLSRPEHRGAWGPQNAVTKLSATLMSTVDYQGFPQRFALMEAGTTASAASVFDDDEDPETTAQSVAGGPGRMLELPGVKAVGQWDPADMQAFLQPLGFYVRAMAAATATPLRFFDPQGTVPSGEALRADEAPLAARIVDREELWGETWSELLVFAAKVAGIAVPPAVDVSWAPVQTVDDLQGWQTVQVKQAAGVPSRQALTEAGYTSDLVEGWLAESAAPNLQSRLALLREVATALQPLAAAVESGVVDQAQVRALAAAIFAELTPQPSA